MARIPIDSLDVSQIERLQEGVNLIDARLIVFKDGASFRVTRNVCRHQGGCFEKRSSSTVECPRHGWVLDCASMRYVNPPGTLVQEECRFEVQADGGWLVYSEELPEPWGAPPPKSALAAGELTVTYLAHACVLIQAGGYRIATDPWLTGPAFLRGWWLEYAPPQDWLERLASVDAIFVSHGHSDHLNYPTLARLAQVNPKVRIVVPRLTPEVWSGRFLELPFPVTEVPSGTWSRHGPVSLMFLPDALAPDLDTAMLIEYRGHRILNTVDCSQPNGNHLPHADLLLTDYSSGASGFPACFAEMFGDETAAIVDRKRDAFVEKTLGIVDRVRPEVYIPFAGSFVEAHPLDADVRRLNLKNDPREIAAQVEARGVTAWVPEPGGVFDLATRTHTAGTCAAAEWDFATVDAELRRSLDFAPLQDLQGVRRYFEWAGFRDYDLVLRVVETLDERPIREYCVDFRDLSFPAAPPPGVPLLEARIRADSLRHIMQHGLGWDPIYIGFQGRFVVTPDIYHLQFWNHFARLDDKPAIDWS